MNTHPSKCSPSDYLNPELFITGYDLLNKHRPASQYKTGLTIGLEAKTIGISANGCWFAAMKDNSLMTSYEVIGYHANTCELLKGFLDSGCRFIVYRQTESGITETEVKP